MIDDPEHDAESPQAREGATPPVPGPRTARAAIAAARTSARPPAEPPSRRVIPAPWQTASPDAPHRR